MTIKKINFNIFILAALLSSTLFLSGCFLSGCSQKPTVFEIRRDDVVSSISVTGKVQSSKKTFACGSYPVKFSQVHVSSGDVIHCGDVLASLDQQYMQTQIDEASFQMSAALQYISMIENSRQIVRVVRAPVGGTVKAIRIDSNSIFDNNAFNIDNPALLISTKDEMFCWLKATAEKGQAFEVLIGDEEVTGTVDKVENGKIRLTIPSDLFSVGTEAIVSINGNTYKASLFLSEYTPIFWENGTVKSILVKENQEISYMSSLFEVNQYDNGFYEFKKQFEKAQSMYEYYTELKEHPDYLASFDGIVDTAPLAGIEYHPGGTMFEIYSDSDTVVKLSIDEFDINKIRVGQIVKLSSEVAQQENIECTVTSISQIGVYNQNTNNPWPLFEVTAIPNYDVSLRIGSTVYGKVITDKAEDVLVVPLRAIHHTSDMTRRYVCANIDQSSPYYGNAGNDLPANAIIVKTGIQDNTFIEITYGIEEGLEIFLD